MHSPRSILVTQLLAGLVVQYHSRPFPARRETRVLATAQFAAAKPQPRPDEGRSRMARETKFLLTNQSSHTILI